MNFYLKYSINILSDFFNINFFFKLHLDFACYHMNHQKKTTRAQKGPLYEEQKL